MLRLSTTPAEDSQPTDRLMADELRLHERVVEHDESALLECFDRVAGLVYCAALARTGDQASAEDVTEAAFVALWRDPAAFPPSQGPLGLQLLRRMAAGRVNASPGQELASAGRGQGSAAEGS
jgi:Sigma-70 region 2